MRIGLIGASGYLGVALQKFLLEEKIELVILNHKLQLDLKADALDMVIDAGFPRDIYRKKVRNNYFINLNSRLKYCQNYNVPYVYFGSISSYSPIQSKYGSAKEYSENLVKSYGGVVFRFGLVVNSKSPGGRYLEVLKMIEKMPIVLLPHRDFFPIAITKIEDFIDGINNIIDKRNFAIPETMAAVQWTNLNSLMKSSCNKKTFIISKVLTSLLCRLIRIVPLGKYDNLKAIAYKNSE